MSETGKKVGKKVGVPEKVATRGTWVQTDRASHEAWGQLAIKHPRAAALLHILVARMGGQNAVVISQELLSKIMGTSLPTVKRALADLRETNFIEVISLGKGTTRAYVINSRVAWSGSRGGIQHSVFNASVVADMAEQDQLLLSNSPLVKIPVIFNGELQSPAGSGAQPPSQPALEGLEPDLPTRE